MFKDDMQGASLLRKKYIRVNTIRSNGIVEFDFAVGAPEIFVELVMPRVAFEDFCTTNDVTDVTGQPIDESDFTYRLSQVLSGEKG